MTVPTRLLLDTHVWLWMLTDPERLGSTRAIIEDAETELLLSAVTSWEIAIKHAIGRLSLPESPGRYVPQRIRDTGVTPLPIEHAHTLAVADLARHHNDPFDRLLIAQSRLEGAPLVTADSAFEPYDLPLVRVTSTATG